jgi:ABC-type spermidine/putrescine transport system permease subunit I
MTTSDLAGALADRGLTRAAARRGRVEAAAGLGLVALPVLVLVVLVLVPTIRMVVGTVLTPDGPSLSRYVFFFTDAYSMANLRYTLAMTLVSSVAALVASTIIALYLRFSRGRIATAIHALSLFPLFVPSIIISCALVRFLGPNGLMQLILESLGLHFYRTPYLTPVGPFLAFLWENIPLPVLVISAGLSQVSDAAIEAARDLGAGSLRILGEILLPQLRRSMLIAFALTFLGVIGAYTVPCMLGPPAPEMLGVFMQRTLGNLQNPSAAEVQAVVLMVLAGVVGSLYILTMIRSARR